LIAKRKLPVDPTIITPLKPKLVLRFSPYLKENTTLHNYKNETVKAV
jgi:hypothetical protein